MEVAESRTSAAQQDRGREDNTAGVLLRKAQDEKEQQEESVNAAVTESLEAKGLDEEQENIAADGKKAGISANGTAESVVQLRKQQQEQQPQDAANSTTQLRQRSSNIATHYERTKQQVGDVSKLQEDQRQQQVPSPQRDDTGAGSKEVTKEEIEVFGDSYGAGNRFVSSNKEEMPEVTAQVQLPREEEGEHVQKKQQQHEIEKWEAADVAVTEEDAKRVGDARDVSVGGAKQQEQQETGDRKQQGKEQDDAINESRTAHDANTVSAKQKMSALGQRQRRQTQEADEEELAQKERKEEQGEKRELDTEPRQQTLNNRQGERSQEDGVTTEEEGAGAEVIETAPTRTSNEERQKVQERKRDIEDEGVNQARRQVTKLGRDSGKEGVVHAGAASKERSETDTREAAAEVKKQEKDQGQQTQDIQQQQQQGEADVLFQAENKLEKQSCHDTHRLGSVKSSERRGITAAEQEVREEKSTPPATAKVSSAGGSSTRAAAGDRKSGEESTSAAAAAASQRGLGETQEEGEATTSRTTLRGSAAERNATTSGALEEIETLTPSAGGVSASGEAAGKGREEGKKLRKKKKKEKPTVFESTPLPSKADAAAHAPAAALLLRSKTQTVFVGQRAERSSAHFRADEPVETKQTKVIFQSEPRDIKKAHVRHDEKLPETRSRQAAPVVYEAQRETRSSAHFRAVDPVPDSLSPTATTPEGQEGELRKAKTLGAVKTVFESQPAPSKATVKYDTKLETFKKQLTVYESQPVPANVTASWREQPVARRDTRTVFENQPKAVRVDASAHRPLSSDSEYETDTEEEQEEHGS